MYHRRALILLALHDDRGLTLYDLGLQGSVDLASWNSLVWGNCGITLGLFVVRCLWFAGIGRHNSIAVSNISNTKTKKR